MNELRGIKRKIDTTGRITIPSSLRNILGVDKGDEGTWQVTNNGNLLLKFGENENVIIQNEKELVD